MNNRTLTYIGIALAVAPIVGGLLPEGRFRDVYWSIVGRLYLGIIVLGFAVGIVVGAWKLLERLFG